LSGAHESFSDTNMGAAEWGGDFVSMHNELHTHTHTQAQQQG